MVLAVKRHLAGLFAPVLSIFFIFYVIYSLFYYTPELDTKNITLVNDEHVALKLIYCFYILEKEIFVLLK